MVELVDGVVKTPLPVLPSLRLSTCTCMKNTSLPREEKLSRIAANWFWRWFPCVGAAACLGVLTGALTGWEELCDEEFPILWSCTAAEWQGEKSRTSRLYDVPEISNRRQGGYFEARIWHGIRGLLVEELRSPKEKAGRSSPATRSLPAVFLLLSSCMQKGSV